METELMRPSMLFESINMGFETTTTRDTKWKLEDICPCRLAALLCRIPLFNCLEGSQDLEKWCKLLQHFEQKFRGRCIKGWQMHNAPSWYYSFDLGGFQAIHVARVHWSIEECRELCPVSSLTKAHAAHPDEEIIEEPWSSLWLVDMFHFSREDGLLIACPLQ